MKLCSINKLVLWLCNWDYESVSPNTKLNNEINLFFVQKVDRRSAIIHVFTKTPPTQIHERSYGSCKMNRIYFVQSSTDECKKYWHLSILQLHLVINCCFLPALHRNIYIIYPYIFRFKKNNNIYTVRDKLFYRTNIIQRHMKTNDIRTAFYVCSSDPFIWKFHYTCLHGLHKVG